MKSPPIWQWSQLNKRDRNQQTSTKKYVPRIRSKNHTAPWCWPRRPKQPQPRSGGVLINKAVQRSQPGQEISLLLLHQYRPSEGILKRTHPAMPLSTGQQDRAVCPEASCFRASRVVVVKGGQSIKTGSGSHPSHHAVPPSQSRLGGKTQRGPLSCSGGLPDSNAWDNVMTL